MQLSHIDGDRDELRRWRTWELEVLLSMEMPRGWCRAVAADAALALDLLARLAGPLSLLQLVASAFHYVTPSEVLLPEKVEFTADRFTHLAGLPDEDLVDASRPGTATFSGFAVQVAAELGRGHDEVAEESAMATVASMVLARPRFLTDLRRWSEDSSSADWQGLCASLASGYILRERVPDSMFLSSN